MNILSKRLPRIRQILKHAIKNSSIPELADWFREDQEGKWASHIYDLIEDANREIGRQGLDLTEDQINHEIATAIQIIGLGAVIRQRKEDDEGDEGPPYDAATATGMYNS